VPADEEQLVPTMLWAPTTVNLEPMLQRRAEQNRVGESRAINLEAHAAIALCNSQVLRVGAVRRSVLSKNHVAKIMLSRMCAEIYRKRLTRSSGRLHQP